MYRFLPSLAFTLLLILALHPDFGIDSRRADAPARLPVFDTEAIFDINGDDRPNLTDTHKIARGDSWIGETPCGPEIFAAPDYLPGLGPRQSGPEFTQTFTVKTGENFNGAPTYLYKTETGTTLQLVEPRISYYDLSGRTFRAVRQDLQKRRPLNHITKDAQAADRIVNQDRMITVGYILSPSSLSYRFTRFGPHWKDGDFRMNPEDTVLTSAHEVVLPRWTGYSEASPRDQRKWDDFLCSTAHHELGHLQIHLNLLAKSLPGYEALGSQTRIGFNAVVDNYRTTVSDRIADRQAAYHLHNNGGTKRGMIELPYAELPFPWLEDPRAEN